MPWLAEIVASTTLVLPTRVGVARIMDGSGGYIVLLSYISLFAILAESLGLSTSILQHFPNACLVETRWSVLLQLMLLLLALTRGTPSF